MYHTRARAAALAVLLVAAPSLTAASDARRSPSPAPRAAAARPRPLSPSPNPSCTVGWGVNDWGSGFVASLTVNNAGSAAINAWKLEWTFPGYQKVVNVWNGVVTQSGQAVTVVNAAYNGAIAAGGSVALGFQGTYTGPNLRPATVALNGRTCAIQ